MRGARGPESIPADTHAVKDRSAGAGAMKPAMTARRGPGRVRLVGVGLDGDEIPVEAFVRAAECLAGLLVEVDRSASGRRRLDWRIAALRAGSASLVLRPTDRKDGDDDYGARIIGLTLSGISILEASAARPDHFTDEALARTEALAQLADDQVARVAVFSEGGKEPGRRLEITRRLGANASLVIGAASTAIGSVEGTLEELTIHGQDALAVYDSITGRRIECRCDRETVDRAAAFLGRRITVHGEVRYDRQGEPKSVTVESIEPPGEPPFTQPEDIRGLFTDDPVDLAEWSRYVREK